ncbi:hypothetical protein M9Y10_024027 [Tritrichomonas musculus]|uniref:Uncharacterized protein n=1 Tax=Tritrichomonas musculus TaxID=1915356 RepID=A0ABR2KWX5_9EUKA
MNDARGLFGLALCYKRGTGVNKDKHKAIEYYKKEAEFGDNDGQEELKRLRIQMSYLEGVVKFSNLVLLKGNYRKCTFK